MKKLWKSALVVLSSFAMFLTVCSCQKDNKAKPESYKTEIPKSSTPENKVIPNNENSMDQKAMPNSPMMNEEDQEVMEEQTEEMVPQTEEKTDEEDYSDVQSLNFSEGSEDEKELNVASSLEEKEYIFGNEIAESSSDEEDKDLSADLDNDFVPEIETLESVQNSENSNIDHADFLDKVVTLEKDPKPEESNF